MYHLQSEHLEQAIKLTDLHVFLSYFENIAHNYVSSVRRMFLCGFVSLYVRMFVARANKVDGTMS